MKNFNIKASEEETTTIDIYGDIGESWFEEGVSLKNIVNQLKQIKSSKIKLNVASLGGDVFEGLAIHDVLKMHSAKIETRIIGATASMGTIVALAGDEITMSDNSLFLIHNAWSGMMGNKYDFEKMAEELDVVDTRLKNIYRNKTGMTDKKVESLMKKERWIEAKEAKDLGFIDKIFKPAKLAASYNSEYKRIILNKFKNKMELKELKTVIGEFEKTDDGVYFNDEMLIKLNEIIASKANEVDIAEALSNRENELNEKYSKEILDAQNASSAKEKEFIVVKKDKELVDKSLIDLKAKYNALESERNQLVANGTHFINEPEIVPKELTEKEKLQAKNVTQIFKNIKKFN